MGKINNYPLLFKLSVIKFYYNNPDVTIKNLLKIFNISNGTLYNWIYLYKNNCLTEKKKYVKKSIFPPEVIKYITSYVLKFNHFSCNNMIRNIKRKFNFVVSRSFIYSILKKNNITFKKYSVRNILAKKKTFTKKLKVFTKQVKNISFDNIISIDECHIDTHITKKYGWNTKGIKINKSLFSSQRKRCTIICAVSNKKILHHMVINTSATSQSFTQFIKELIEINKLSNCYLLLDNASIHHSRYLKEYLATTTCSLLYNVPYSPEFNPIEKVFSKFKNTMRNKNNNNIMKLKTNISKCLKRITKLDLHNFFVSSLTF